MKLKIASLNPGDFKEFSKISLLKDQAGFIEPIGGVLERFKGSNAETNVYLAGARCDGCAAGIIVVTPTYETAKLQSAVSSLCWIDTLAVDKEFQRRGVGRKLLEHTIKSLQGRYDALCLTVNVRNESAKAMYLNFGFQDSGELYLGGTAGPQHIMIFPLHTVQPESIDGLNSQ